MPTVGNVWRATIRFYDEDDALVDPVSVTLWVQHSNGGTPTAYAYGGGDALRESVGVYYIDVAPTAAGRWKVAGEGDATFGALDDLVDGFEHFGRTGGKMGEQRGVA